MLEQDQDYVKNYLLKNVKPAYLTTNQKELRVRCPYCGDSKSNKSHAHLYIEMKPPFKFYCQKCSTGGILSHETLRDFQIYDSNLAVTIHKINKSIPKTLGTKSYKNNILINNLYDEDIEERNLEYIERRFDSSFDISELNSKFKCVLNPPRFINDNNINLGGNTFDFSNAVGFISSANSYVVFRDVSGMQKKRYNNLNLSPDLEIPGGKIYNIRNTIDIMKNNKLIITEGIFDIIGVYKNIYDSDDNGNIFAAACGKGYNSVISYFVHRGIYDINVEIFSDSDVPPEFYSNLKRSCPYIEKITVFYNEKSKDYGVPKSEIKLRKVVF